MDVDFARAGRNISIALPHNLRLSVRDAISSLEMGLLPIRELSDKAGAQYRNPDDPELRIDFVTPSSGDAKTIRIDDLGLALEPLKFMEFSLEGTTQAAVFSGSSACVVNLPDPARYAGHKLIVHGERPVAEQAKSNKDIQQAAALIEWHVASGQADRVQAAWDDAQGRGPGWRKRALEGRRALLRASRSWPRPCPRCGRRRPWRAAPGRASSPSHSHSGSMPAALMTFPHFCVSACWNFASSSGVVVHASAPAVS
jgi:hypothetical protein